MLFCVLGPAWWSNMCVCLIPCGCWLDALRWSALLWNLGLGWSGTRQCAWQAQLTLHQRHQGLQHSCAQHTQHNSTMQYSTAQYGIQLCNRTTQQPRHITATSSHSPAWRCGCLPGSAPSGSSTAAAQLQSQPQPRNTPAAGLTGAGKRWFTFCLAAMMAPNIT